MKTRDLIKSFVVIFAVIGFEIVFSFCFSSCKTVPKFSGTNELCGVIVDENNKPVNEYIVRCGLTLVDAKTVITNDRGIFVFHNMPAGKYFFWGEKQGWAKIEGEPFLFNTRDKFFCCKVNSFDTALDNAEAQIQCGNYKKALEILEGLSYRRRTPEEKVVDYYKQYIKAKIKEKKMEEKDEK